MSKLDDLKKELLESVKSYISNKNQLTIISKAIDFGQEKHQNQVRASGEPYFCHPIEVSMIMAKMKLDVPSIVTALLHDTVEDTNTTLEEIEKDFSKEISELVDGVTKLTRIEYQPDTIRQAENFRKLLLAMSKDIRVLLVKLADRLHNMRTLNYIKSSDKRRRIAFETMEIYAPLAERIGIQQFKNELQDLSFSELHPDVRNSIINRLNYLRNKDNNIIDKIIKQLSNLMQGNNIEATVSGREKTPCSIWRKMERKNVGFEQLSDIIAFRIIVNNVNDCYTALGIVHSTYRMVPENFKDFISNPKNNGYQSLHSIIMGPEQQRIEVQIRTEVMHEIAEYGVAAHWSYKQNKDYNPDGAQFKWIKELLHILENTDNPEDFLENTKLAMYYDQVFCFTPKGDLIALPKGATPVDFAFAVHTGVGIQCVGAKVNGNIVPLRYQLNNGDQVDIICSKTQTPSPTWEQFAITGKALTEIRKYIRKKKKDEYGKLGKDILSKTIKKEGFEQISDKILEPIVGIFKKKNAEELYIAIGEGMLKPMDIIKALYPNKKLTPTKKNFFDILKFKRKSKDFAVPIKGLVPGMAVHFAGCCHPLPGDLIVGIVNSGKGITIHRTDCETLENFVSEPERWIEVSWESEANDESHIGRIKAIISHEPGSLAAISNSIAKSLGNISNLKITNRSIDFFEIIIDIEVRGKGHLTNIMTALRAQSCVHSVERYKL